MKILFSDSTIGSIINSKNLLADSYGNESSKIIMRRLFQLKAAENLGEFLPEGSPPLECEYIKTIRDKLYFKVKVDEVFNINFYCNCLAKSSLTNCWTNIKNITIKNIKGNKYES